MFFKKLQECIDDNQLSQFLLKETDHYDSIPNAVIIKFNFKKYVY